jgi:hypothetical protein
MHQQINLYQPIFRHERKLFSAATVSVALMLVLAGLLAFWGFGTWNVAKLEREVATVREQQQSQERLASASGTLRAARANPVEVQARIKRLSAELAERTRAMGLLRGGAAGETTGFAARMAALARQHVDGLWLDHLAMHGGPGTMSIGGGTLSPDSVPRYLSALASEPTLMGTRFDEFVIEQPSKERPQPGVRFRAASAALLSDEEESK